MFTLVSSAHSGFYIIWDTLYFKATLHNMLPGPKMYCKCKYVSIQGERPGCYIIPEELNQWLDFLYCK